MNRQVSEASWSDLFLGEEVAKQLVDSGLVKSVTDLYGLTKKQLLTLPGFADTKAQNLLDGIEASKDRGLARRDRQFAV